MAKETAEMEERLARLKTDLAAEAEMREATGPRVGGSRWRSARTDRGSVRAYAKDVKTRHKQQLQQRPPHGIFATGGGGGAGFGGGKAQPQAGAGARAAAALRDEQYQQRQQHQHLQHREQQPPAETKQGNFPTTSTCKASPTFHSKEVSRWGVGDTVEWLKSLGLGKHAGVFQQNEISGPILLEVGLDDLDYMDVRVLAHRKCILKGIEDLRRGGGRPCIVDTPPPPAPITPFLPNVSNTSSSGRRTDGTGNEAVAISTQQSGDGRAGGDHPSSPVRRKKQHWSAVKPLAENPTKGDVQDSLSSVNLADGHYDEAAARSSFADAVAEWRGEGRNSTTTAAASTTAAPPSLHRPSVVGRAPLAGMPAERPEEDTKRPSRGIKRGLLGGGEDSGGAKECWTNPFSTPRASETGAAAGEEPHPVGLERNPSLSPRRTKTVIVVDASQQEASGLGRNDAPALDEEAEHEAFRRAVAEWNRTRGKNLTAERKGSGSNDSDLGISSKPAEPSGATTGTETLPSRRTTEAMAEELREQMDAEHRLQAKELEEKKRALLEGLETAKAERPSSKTGLHQEGDHDCEGGRQNRESSSEGGGRSLGGFGGDVFEGNGSQQSRHEDEEDDDDDRSTVSFTMYGSFEGNVDNEERSREGGVDVERGGGGSVEIEMMDSVLGADWPVEGGKSYVVDEAESGDES